MSYSLVQSPNEAVYKIGYDGVDTHHYPNPGTTFGALLGLAAVYKTGLNPIGQKVIIAATSLYTLYGIADGYMKDLNIFEALQNLGENVVAGVLAVPYAEVCTCELIGTLSGELLGFGNYTSVAGNLND